MTTTKPKIELRNIKTLARMSDETHCYEATLYVDGEHWGSVGNAGHGGPDDFHPAKGKTYADLHDLNLRIAQTYPADDSYGITVEESLEGLCCELVNDHLREKDYKRVLKKPAYINDQGHCMTFTIPKGWNLERTLDALRVKRPDLKFLNDIPFADAKAAMQGAGL